MQGKSTQSKESSSSSLLITKLVLEGGTGNLTFTETGVSSDSVAIKGKIEEGRLTITGAGGGGSTVITQSFGGSYINSFSGGGTIIIDGVDVTALLREKRTGIKEDSEEAKKNRVYNFPGTARYQVRMFSCKGGGRLQIPDWMIDKNVVSLSVTGSGTLTLPQEITLDNITATVTGSGDVEGSGVVVGSASLNVTGSGDIKGITARDQLRAVLTGSGDIRATAMAGCNVDKEKTGSGDIRIHKLGK